MSPRTYWKRWLLVGAIFPWYVIACVWVAYGLAQRAGCLP